jgi:hypothetical protein
MGTMLLVLVLAGCLPSAAYLCFLAIGKLKARLGRLVPGEGLTQMVLAAIAAFCFCTGLILVVLPFTSHIPYYKQEKGLIVALLFMLMGVLALQVMQFIRIQTRAYRSRRETYRGISRRQNQHGRRQAARTYAVSDSKS